MGKKRDITGEKFGRLLAVRPCGLDKVGNVLWLCKCDCGKEKTVQTTKLVQGKVRSCGCLMKESCINSTKTHGMYGTRIWSIWAGMKGRCNKNSGKDFHNYKERGITVCEEWQKFEPFYEWAMKNGYEDNLTIERVDGSKGYSPENCTWKTMTEQARNRRNNTKVTVNGVTHTMIEWSEINGIPYTTIICRMQRGWDPVDAVTREVQIHKKRSV